MFATSDSGPLFFQLAVSTKRGKRGFEVLTAAMSASRITSNLLVGIVGLEPTRPLGHQILSLTRLPIPSYPHKCGFCLLVPQTRSTYAFWGPAVPHRQHHLTTRIYGCIVVIISPVYILASHAGPNPLSAPGFLAVNFLAYNIDKLHGFV